MKLLDKNVALQYCGDDEEIFQSVLEAFEEELAGQIGRAEDLYARQDWKEFVVLVHGVKNAALTAGAVPLSEASKNMEFAGKENRIDDIHADFPAYIDLMKETLEALESVYGGEGKQHA